MTPPTFTQDPEANPFCNASTSLSTEIVCTSCAVRNKSSQRLFRSLSVPGYRKTTIVGKPGSFLGPFPILFARLIRPGPKGPRALPPRLYDLQCWIFPTNRYTGGMASGTSVAINFADKEIVILGTEYAGEMKKGISPFCSTRCLLSMKFLLFTHLRMRARMAMSRSSLACLALTRLSGY